LAKKSYFDRKSFWDLISKFGLLFQRIESMADGRKIERRKAQLPTGFEPRIS